MRSPAQEDTVGRIMRWGRSGEFIVRASSFAAAARTAWHSHDYACLTVVLDGAYQEVFGARSYEHAPGTLVHKPAGEVHRNRYGAPATTLMVQIDGEGSSLEQLGLPILREAFTVRSAEVSRAGIALVRALVEGDRSPLEAQCRVFDLLDVAGRRLGPARPQAPSGTAALAREWLHEHFREPLDAATLAATIGVSPSYLARAFRRAYGCTLGQAQRQLRIACAMRGLRDRSRSTLEVAHEAGFSDQSHMTRLFRRHLGVTPGAYRRASA